MEVPAELTGERREADLRKHMQRETQKSSERETETDAVRETSTGANAPRETETH